MYGAAGSTEYKNITHAYAYLGWLNTSSKWLMICDGSLLKIPNQSFGVL